MAYKFEFEKLKEEAEAGNVESQFNLGSVYYNGEGRERDFDEAVKWFRKTADRGLPAGQYAL